MFTAPKQKTGREALPEGVLEIEAPRPLEISGVATIAGGYAVVGDETGGHGRVWPGGARFELPGGVKGPESIDVAVNPAGETLWIVLGENRSRLADWDGGSHVFDPPFVETDGRGLEGVAARWHGDGWQVAVAWEGGFFDPDTDRDGEHALPRVATFGWRKGKGVVTGSMETFELDVEVPSKGQRFRAPDLAWDGDGVLVLLASTDARRKKKRHTWLQRFDLHGRRTRAPCKLEERWGASGRAATGRRSTGRWRAGGSSSATTPGKPGTGRCWRCSSTAESGQARPALRFGRICHIRGAAPSRHGCCRDRECANFPCFSAACGPGMPRMPAAQVTRNFSMFSHGFATPC